MGRPKGTGRGLVKITVRVEPETYQRMVQLAKDQGVAEAEGIRIALNAALDQDFDFEKGGYNDGLRRAQQEARAAITEALEGLWK